MGGPRAAVRNNGAPYCLTDRALLPPSENIKLYFRSEYYRFTNPPPPLSILKHLLVFLQQLPAGEEGSRPSCGEKGCTGGPESSVMVVQMLELIPLQHNGREGVKEKPVALQGKAEEDRCLQ